MNEQKQGIGDRFQKETKYGRDALRQTASFEIEETEPFTCYPNALEKISIVAAPAFASADFWEVLKRRRSHRNFSAAPLPFSMLCQLLYAVQGITAKKHGYLFRTAPSAGALYPIETYLLVTRIENLQSGIYHLNIRDQCLELLRKGSYEQQLASAALGQFMIAEAPVTFIWTAVVNRSKWKYRQRAYRYIYMDAGHIGQNLYLAATALGCGCCTIGAFFDDEVNTIIGVDGTNETAVYMGVVGHKG